MTFQEKLIRENKKRWLDIGCGKNFEKGFYYLDVFSKKDIPSKYRKKYFKINILKPSDKELKSIGKFNLVRMQHVIEHFSYEEAKIVIKNVGKLLKQGGYFIITTPDLRINIGKYLRKEYNKLKTFKKWAIAKAKIPKDAPASFFRCSSLIIYLKILTNGVTITKDYDIYSSLRVFLRI